MIMVTKKQSIKKFWIINTGIASLIFLGFFLIVFLMLNNVVNLDVDIIYFQIILVIICLSIIQFIICLIYYLIKIKQHSFWEVLVLIYLIAIIYFQIRISFGIMGGFLGDM